MVDFMENPKIKWMILGYPMLGNLHMDNLGDVTGFLMRRMDVSPAKFAWMKLLRW